MPFQIPAHIQEYVNANLPAGYELVWIRGIVTEAAAGSYPRPNISGPVVGLSRRSPFTIVNVADMDAAEGSKRAGFSLEIANNNRVLQFEMYDPVSVLFHRHKGTNEFTPRYILHHNREEAIAAYYNFEVEERRTLSLGQAQRLKDNWLFCNPKNAFKDRLLALVQLFPYFALISLIVFAFFDFCITYQTTDFSEHIYISKIHFPSWQNFVYPHLVLMRAFAFLINYPIIAAPIYLAWLYGYYAFTASDTIDLSKFYVSIANKFHAHVKQNPAPPLWIVKPR